MPCFVREQLVYPYSLNRFTEHHVICKDGPSGSNSKGNAVELIGKQFTLEKRFSQRMVFGIFPNLTHFIPYPVKVERPVDVLFRIRIDGDVMSKTFHLFDSL